MVYPATLKDQKKVIEDINQSLGKVQRYFSLQSNFNEELYAYLLGPDRDIYFEKYKDVLDFYLGPPPIETMK